MCINLTWKLWCTEENEHQVPKYAAQNQIFKLTRPQLNLKETSLSPVNILVRVYPNLDKILTQQLKIKI